MIRKTRLAFTLLFTLLMALLLAACSDSEAESGASQEEGNKIFVFARGADSVSLDPSGVTDSESENVSQSMLETLVTFAEGETTVAPMLAEEWVESEDGMTFTFTLREGVKFHDGTDFNAEAVVYNFDRWKNADDAEKFPMYGTVFGGFEGDETHILESVKALDEKTVEVKLNQVKPTFLKDLALTPFSISSPEAIEKFGDDYGSNPVGTGPFVFNEWIRNDRVVMDKKRRVLA